MSQYEERSSDGDSEYKSESGADKISCVAYRECADVLHDSDESIAASKADRGSGSDSEHTTPGKGSSAHTKRSSRPAHCRSLLSTPSRALRSCQMGGKTFSRDGIGSLQRPGCTEEMSKQDTALQAATDVHSSSAARVSSSDANLSAEQGDVMVKPDQNTHLPSASAEGMNGLHDQDKEMQRIREENIKAMLSDTINACRTSVIPKLLQLKRLGHESLPALVQVKEGEAQLRKAFTSPQDGQPPQSIALKRRLSAMRRFVPWGSAKGFVMPTLKPIGVHSSSESEPAEEAKADDTAETELAEGVEQLIVWSPGEGEEGEPVKVDNMLTRWLRAHQREGVQFMFECVAGLKTEGGYGCILADDMGLGKTLQGITLMWTLLQGGHEQLGGKPIAKRVMIVCPTSLVNNWDSECTKWLQGRVKTLPLCESSRDDIICSVKQYLSASRPYHVIILSYETFRIHAALFAEEGSVDLLICDEAHRLKNDDTKTNKALDSLPCKRRVLLSGTPMQNHLDEFYAMVNFCNPGVLGDAIRFRRYFETPILASREPFASEDVISKGEERSAELSAIVNDFILRRTNKLLSAHLPPKLVEVVCCKMTDMQRGLYCHFLESKAAARLLNAGKGGTNMLSAITSLKKLCNHPKLIYDVINSNTGEKALGFEGCDKFFPPGLFDNGRAGRGGLPQGWQNLSGKMAIMAKMLDILWTRTNDKIVIVSNYTQTLDLIGTLCRTNDYPFVRLDGTTSINKRQKLVETFCDPKQRNFVFLLSSKAGGCGLNLVGANRLVLFDPDWNPATDKQAAARVWRDGQKRRVFVYRFLTTGTLEEKIFQRQLSKEGLSNVVNQSGKSAASMMSADELADLFTLRQDTISDTYDSMASYTAAETAIPVGQMPATSPVEDPALTDVTGAERPVRDQIGNPTEEEVKDWAWHRSTTSVDDDVLKLVGDEHISFVFSLTVDGMPVKEPCGLQYEKAPDGTHNVKASSTAAVTVAAAPSRGALPKGRASFPAPKRAGGSTGLSSRRHSVASKPDLKTPASLAAVPQPRLSAPAVTSPQPTSARAAPNRSTFNHTANQLMRRAACNMDSSARTVAPTDAAMRPPMPERSATPRALSPSSNAPGDVTPHVCRRRRKSQPSAQATQRKPQVVLHKRLAHEAASVHQAKSGTLDCSPEDVHNAVQQLDRPSPSAERGHQARMEDANEPIAASENREDDKTDGSKRDAAAHGLSMERQPLGSHDVNVDAPVAKKRRTVVHTIPDSDDDFE